MKATNIEFRYRGLWFGLIFWISFSAYWIDPQNLGSLTAEYIARFTGITDDVAIHIVFGIAGAIAIIGALLRTWAASYLTKDIVHDSRLHSESLVADGPYRYTRNPLYLAVDMLALSAALLASRTGAIVMIVGIFTLDYRLILREEEALETNQTSDFKYFRERVPRLFPSFVPKVSKGGRNPDWRSGFISELFFWSFAIGLSIFAVTLEFTHFLIACGVGVSILIILGVQASRKKPLKNTESA